jgi:hypothetical protein
MMKWKGQKDIKKERDRRERERRKKNKGENTVGNSGE